MYKHTFIYVYLLTCTHIYTCMQIYIYMNTYLYLFIYTHTSTYTDYLKKNCTHDATDNKTRENALKHPRSAHSQQIRDPIVVSVSRDRRESPPIIRKPIQRPFFFEFFFLSIMNVSRDVYMRAYFTNVYAYYPKPSILSTCMHIVVFRMHIVVFVLHIVVFVLRSICILP